MSHYHDKTIVHNISQITFIDDVAETLHIPEAVITVAVDSDSYKTYRNIYMPIQSKYVLPILLLRVTYLAYRAARIDVTSRKNMKLFAFLTIILLLFYKFLFIPYNYFLAFISYRSHING